jgi:ATP-dependent DNA helicase RecG
MKLFNMDAIELLQQLNNTDECNWIEAKRGSAVDRSILETICAFSNEPSLGGGYILLGIEQKEQVLSPSYLVTGVKDTDKMQSDLSSQCASMFNLAIRIKISVESVENKNVLVIHVPELPDGQKPAYFKSEGLPRGAFRRIGPSDQRCTDDDLFIFYNKEDSLDSSIVRGASLDDISEEAVHLYRTFRAKVNPYAEELQYNDLDLLHALGCVNKIHDQICLTYAGLLLFGKKISLRRLLPMVRVDYIRVPGNEWIEDPESRFTTIDMRGSLLEMVQRVFIQITDDLPKGFLLMEGEVQAENIGLPSRVLREAIVNALIHRTYRENQPIQIIRYANRIEIRNPGFSLKPEEYLGEPGSKNRNPYIAAVFHETNLAETKGSGIRTMRALMASANLLPPTFESDHSRNQFTARLLFHHFLGDQDVQWLATFASFELNESQRLALIFTKEVGAIDNSSYRQLNSVDTLKASADLRDLRNKYIIEQKGRGKSTYYILASLFCSTDKRGISLSTPPPGLSTPPPGLSTPPPGLSTPLFDKVGIEVKKKISQLGKRINDESAIREIIKEICNTGYFKSIEIAALLNRREDYIKRKFLRLMIANRELEFLYPTMINHPDQAYRTVGAG